MGMAIPKFLLSAKERASSHAAVKDFISGANKWLGGYGTMYAALSLFFGGLAALGPVGLALSFVIDDWEDLRGPFAGAAAALAFLAWLFRNADNYESRRVEQADMDGLIQALTTSLRRLHEAANADPASSEATNYVENVIESLRLRLEPENADNYVRVCIYRRDEEELAEATDGVENGGDLQPRTPRVSVFHKYVFARGGRADFPRREFRDDEEPGKTFMPELFKRGRFARQTPESFGIDATGYAGDENPTYKSFVNIALENQDGEAFAMLTCDSKEAHFFDERRERLIRAFSRLVHLAMTRGATSVNAPVRPTNRRARRHGPRNTTTVRRLTDD